MYKAIRLTGKCFVYTGNAGKLFATVCVSKSTARYEETNAACKGLLSGYINEVNSNIVLRGNPDGVADKWLAKAFETISLSAYFPHHPAPRMLIKVHSSLHYPLTHSKLSCSLAC